MGSISDTMHGFERKELNQVFPVSEGWKESSPRGSGNTYTFTRDLWVGNEQVTVVSLYTPLVRGEEIADLRARYANGAGKSRLAILVPDGSDYSAVPKDIVVITMASFGYESGKIVWLTKKKNAKRVTVNLPAPYAS